MEASEGLQAELKRLVDLHKRDVPADVKFEAKKKQILGLEVSAAAYSRTTRAHTYLLLPFAPHFTREAVTYQSMP